MGVVDVDSGVIDVHNHGDVVADILPVGQRGRGEQSDGWLAGHQERNKPDEIRCHELDVEAAAKQEYGNSCLKCGTFSEAFGILGHLPQGFRISQYLARVCIYQNDIRLADKANAG
jgi:hypothetical protein